MYSIESYLAMVTDRVRTGAYREALQQAVKPGCAVADIGAGTGIFAILACQAGAGRVYAIESDTVIELARQIAFENGLAGQIEFIPETSDRISLPEPVDVVVSDVHGVLPWYEQSMTSLIDARERFLADGGAMIPAREHLWAALAEARDVYRYDLQALNHTGLGVDMSAATRLDANAWRRVTLAPEQLMVDPQQWATVDYGTVSSPHVDGTLSWIVADAGTAHGLCVWFDTELIEGVGFSNAPNEPVTIYGQAFFPLETAVELAAGDRVDVSMKGRLVGNDYAWRWNTRITPADGHEPTRADFDQSTLRATPFSLARLRRSEAGYRAALSEDGTIDRFVLSLMDGATPLSEIASRLAGQFPERFATENDALARVAQLSEKYGR